MSGQGAFGAAAAALGSALAARGFEAAGVWLLVSSSASKVVLLLRHGSVPAQVGGYRCSSGSIPAHPPQKGLNPLTGLCGGC